MKQAPGKIHLQYSQLLFQCGPPFAFLHVVYQKCTWPFTHAICACNYVNFTPNVAEVCMGMKLSG